ncbi:MAG: Sec-independent protein translocase protein TatB [Eubacteriales bacterium]|nr:Sec-independent protein translocase protein TatB [Eubacteriales bacterium]
MFNIGFSELIMILLVAFVIVGPQDLPKVARSLGRAVRSIRKMFDEFKDEAGLDDTISEFKDMQRDINTTIREVDPRKDIQDLKTGTQKALREAEQSAIGKKTPAKGKD